MKQHLSCGQSDTVGYTWCCCFRDILNEFVTDDRKDTTCKRCLMMDDKYGSGAELRLAKPISDIDHRTVDKVYREDDIIAEHKNIADVLNRMTDYCTDRITKSEVRELAKRLQRGYV